jgi:predicted secreted protein
MGPVSGIVVYLLVWWVTLFAVLPWGVRTDETAAGAPANPRLKQKFLITTAVSAVIWCVIAYLIHIRIIDFREFARENPWW